MKTAPSLSAALLLLACGEGDLDPDSVHEVYGMDEDAEDRDDDADTPAPEVGFFPSAACRVPDDLSPPSDENVPEGDVSRPSYIDSSGFFVREGRLYDKHGNDFVMRGVNNAHAWYDTSGRNLAIGALDDISGYGFNTVRIVWEASTGLSVNLLHQIIDCVVQLHMVPMVELHDVTGVPQNLAKSVETGELTPWDVACSNRTREECDALYDVLPPDEANAIGHTRLMEMAEYYSRDDVKAVLLEYEDYLLVNVANEWSGEDYFGGYSAAIEHLRDNGINHTLVIDANGWGQNGQVILDEGQRLLDADPQRNLLFSVHMYEQYADTARITRMLEGAVELELPIIVGEFGPEHGGETIDVEFIFAESARLGTGYLGWSWKGNEERLIALDMSLDWEGEDLTEWGATLVESPNGAGSSQRASMFLF
jgi:hypothetical protein